MMTFPGPAASRRSPLDNTRATRERRRSPRVAMMGTLHGVSIPLDVAIRVVDMSLGGMAIELGIPVPVGAVHEFELELGDGSAVPLRGRVAHSRNIAAKGEVAMYFVGIEFCDEDDASDHVQVGAGLDATTTGEARK